jgi:hypothetical protein
MIQDILKALGCTVYPGPQYLWAFGLTEEASQTTCGSYPSLVPITGDHHQHPTLWQGPRLLPGTSQHSGGLLPPEALLYLVGAHMIY